MSETIHNIDQLPSLSRSFMFMTFTCNPLLDIAGFAGNLTLAISTAADELNAHITDRETALVIVNKQPTHLFMTRSTHDRMSLLS